MIMITTIQQAFCPLFVTYFILGLSSYSMTQPTFRIPWITCLSVLYCLTILIVYIYYYIMTLITWKRFYPSKIHLMSVTINVITMIASATISFYRQEKLRTCMKKLAFINDTLEQLGTSKAYQKLHIYSKRVLIGWIVYSFIISFYLSIWWLEIERDITMAIFAAYILNHCFNVNAFVDLLFIFFLWYVGTRFDKVNEHMRRLLMNENHVPKYQWKKPVDSRDIMCTGGYKQILWISMHIHLELCRIARELNLIFGTQMTFEIVSCIASITTKCFELNVLIMEYQDKVSLNDWFGIICWALIFIIRLCAINYICDYVKIKAKKIDKIFHQLTNMIRYADVWNDIYQFILLTIQHPLQFTGMGLFYFGSGFLRKLFMTILMNVIIMIQMKIRAFYVNM